MKKISIWAAKNPKKAIILIILLKLILIFNGIYLGKVLFQSGLQINEGVTYFLIGLFVIAIIIYPFKETKSNHFKADKIFLRQKTADGFIVLCIFSASIILSNQYQNETLFSGTISFIKKVNAEEISSKSLSEGHSNSVNKTGFIDSNKIKLKKVKKNKRSIAKFFFIKNSPIKNIKNFKFLYFLIVFLSILTGVGLLVLFCYLACSEYTAAAFLTLIGGGLLLIIGATIATKAARRYYKKKALVTIK